MPRALATGGTQSGAVTTSLPFAPELVERADGPLVHIRVGPDGAPVGATAARMLKAPKDRVWKVIYDVDGLAARVPMMQKVQRDGRYATVHLRFGVSLFSANFAFKIDRHAEEDRWVELRYVDGEPRDLSIRHDLMAASDPSRSLLFTYIGFDVFSVGFLAKFFLKHHPEIRYGVYPGSALALLDSVRRVVEK